MEEFKGVPAEPSSLDEVARDAAASSISEETTQFMSGEMGRDEKPYGVAEASFKRFPLALAVRAQRMALDCGQTRTLRLHLSFGAT